MTSNYRASKDEIMSDLMTHIPTITSSTLYQQFGGGGYIWRLRICATGFIMSSAVLETQRSRPKTSSALNLLIMEL